MTSLLERITGTDAPEETPVTNPPPRPRPYSVPWWLGVPGLDPAVPAPADRELAARIAALACAQHVHGPAATAGAVWAKSPAQKYLEWLLRAGGDWDAWVRRYALRRACDDVGVIGAEGILEVAGHAADFVLGRRR